MTDDITRAREARRQEDGFALAIPFFIDDGKYTARESAMFVLGVEFWMVVTLLRSGWRGSRPVHTENVNRLNAYCESEGIGATWIDHRGYEGCETWTEMST